MPLIENVNENQPISNKCNVLIHVDGFGCFPESKLFKDNRNDLIILIRGTNVKNPKNFFTHILYLVKINIKKIKSKIFK